MRKYAIELIPVEIFKKGLLFLMAKAAKDITDYSYKLAKLFSQ